MIEFTDTGITALDYFLLPFYLFVIFKIAFYYRDKFYPEKNPLRPYFIPGLMTKIGGAIFIGLIYNYYYKGGDTFNFFYHAKLINATLTEAPDTWFRLITHHGNDTNLTDAKSLSQMFWYDDTASYTTSCLGAIVGLFCFTRYLEINIIIASIVFIGLWLMFITFAEQYPHKVKVIAIAILFMPGVIVWGSGLFKDSFCIFSVGCLVYSTYILFEKRQLKLGVILLMLLAFVILTAIKAYILIVLFPVLILKIILVYKKRIQKSYKKKYVFFIILGILAFSGMIAVKRVINYLPAFTAGSVLLTMKTQKDYMLAVTDGDSGSSYDLGDFDPTISGVIKFILPAINVTLYRPYPWESKSIIQLFNSFESSIVFLLTLYLILTKNILKTIQKIYYDPNLIACLIFTLIFAFIVGISSYNFGALSRYKIPVSPFYMLFLMILLSDKKLPTTDPSN